MAPGDYARRSVRFAARHAEAWPTELASYLRVFQTLVPAFGRIDAHLEPDAGGFEGAWMTLALRPEGSVHAVISPHPWQREPDRQIPPAGPGAEQWLHRNEWTVRADFVDLLDHPYDRGSWERPWRPPFDFEDLARQTCLAGLVAFRQLDPGRWHMHAYQSVGDELEFMDLPGLRDSGGIEAGPEVIWAAGSEWEYLDSA